MTARDAATTPGAINLLHVFSSFEGLRYSSAGNPWAPPDVQVAAGRNHVVELVNLEGEVYTKLGSPARSLMLTSLFSTASSDYLTDPKILYDVGSGRWFASLMDETSGSVRLAVSAGEDPTGPWRAFGFAASGGCPDQPILGVNDDKVIVSANDFAGCNGGSWLGVQYWVINKGDALAGVNPSFASFGPFKDLFSVHPVRSSGPTATEYMVSVGADKNSTVQLYSVTGVPPGQVKVDRVDLSIRMTNQPPDADQRGTTDLVNTGGAQVQDGLWGGGKLWFAFNDACAPAGDPRKRSCLRLIQVDTVAMRVLQDFDVGAPGTHYFYPAIAADGRGNLVTLFGYSSPSDYPGLMAATQAVGDPPNSLGSPTALKQGSGPETIACSTASPASCRYGDFFGAATDPIDPSRVWVAGEYGTVSGWATQIIGIGVLPLVPLTVRFQVRGGGSTPGFPRLTYMFAGEQNSVQIGASAASYDADIGSSWTVTNPLPGSTPRERWVTAQTTAGIAQAPLDLDLVYEHQYYVTTNPSPPRSGSVSPTTGWHNAGRPMNLSASPGPGWQFEGWNGSGPGSYSGPAVTTSIIVKGPLNETALFVLSPPFYTQGSFWIPTGGIVIAVLSGVVTLVTLGRRGRRPPFEPPPPAEWIEGSVPPPPDQFPLEPPPPSDEADDRTP